MRHASASSFSDGVAGLVGRFENPKPSPAELKQFRHKRKSIQASSIV
jgi:hypothetical protein